MAITDRSPQLLIALAASLTLVSTAPYVKAQLAAAQGDVYLMQVQGEEPIEFRADRIVQHQNRFVTLERDGKTVAAFAGYQIMYVVRQADQAANVYEMQSQDGSTARFRADDMRLDPQGFVELSVDGQLSGIIWNQIRYVKMLDEEFPGG